MPDLSHRLAGGIAWSLFLFPLALFALVKGVPYLLEGLGLVFSLMRSLAGVG